MAHTASIRDLRNAFPKVRKLLEEDGEVFLSEGGITRYRLTAYTPLPQQAAPAVNYWKRLLATQPRVIAAAQARALHEDNRGDR